MDVASADPRAQEHETPGVRRQKTYSASSGYVYQYHFEGFRTHLSDFQYTFPVTSRGWSRRLRIVLAGEALSEWERRHGRKLTASERYAFAKMSLRETLDNMATPEDVPEETRPTAEDLEAISSALDL